MILIVNLELYKNLPKNNELRVVWQFYKWLWKQGKCLLQFNFSQSQTSMIFPIDNKQHKKHRKEKTARVRRDQVNFSDVS